MTLLKKMKWNLGAHELAKKRSAHAVIYKLGSAPVLLVMIVKIVNKQGSWGKSSPSCTQPLNLIVPVITENDVVQFIHFVLSLKVDKHHKTIHLVGSNHDTATSTAICTD